VLREATRHFSGLHLETRNLKKHAPRWCAIAEDCVPDAIFLPVHENRSRPYFAPLDHAPDPCARRIVRPISGKNGMCAPFLRYSFALIIMIISVIDEVQGVPAREDVIDFSGFWN